MARMIEAATASQPDGLVVSIPDADALKEPIMAAKAAGIPVVVIDSGLDQVRDWKLDLMSAAIPNSPMATRRALAMADAGIKHGVCVNHEVGNASLDQRCEGFAKALGETRRQGRRGGGDDGPDRIHPPAGSLLTAQATVDGILTLGPTVGVPILAMLDERGLAGKYKVATFDLSPEVLAAIDAGKMLFALDSQQFLMGAYPVIFLVDKVRYKTFPASEF